MLAQLPGAAGQEPQRSQVGRQVGRVVAARRGIGLQPHILVGRLQQGGPGAQRPDVRVKALIRLGQRGFDGYDQYLGLALGEQADGLADAGRCTADGTGPFDVLFDRAESLGDAGQPGKRPLVLAGGKGLAALRAFQRILGGSMSDAGIGRYARSAFTPHVTLLRDESFVPTHPVRPVRWRVRELVLIDSWQGLTRYDVLGRWPLTGRPPGLGDW